MLLLFTSVLRYYIIALLHLSIEWNLGGFSCSVFGHSAASGHRFRGATLPPMRPASFLFFCPSSRLFSFSGTPAVSPHLFAAVARFLEELVPAPFFPVVTYVFETVRTNSTLTLLSSRPSPPCGLHLAASCIFPTDLTLCCSTMASAGISIEE